MLCNKSTSFEIYRVIFSTFLNGKKIPCIPTLFSDNKFVINFSEEAELLDIFFVK